MTEEIGEKEAAGEKEASEEEAASEEEEAAASEVILGRGKCTRQPVPTAGRNAKFRLSQPKASQSIAGTAILKEESFNPPNLQEDISF